ncbi:permease PerM [Salmonella enterica subsp. enterica]|nr:permease PerM [Salmonella enterica subsp. enterica]
MLEMLMQWYRRRFSDPEAIALLVILVAGFSILFFFSGPVSAAAGRYRTGLPAGVADGAPAGDWLFPALGSLHCPYPFCRHSVINGVCGDADCLAAGYFT